MPLATALDGLSFQLASAYTAGAGQLQLTSGAGTSIQASLTRQGASAISSTAPIYVVLVPKANFSSSGLVSSFTNCVQYKVTGLSSNTLTGVTALYSGTDRNFASGDVVVFGTLSQYINDTNTILGQIRARDIKADDGYSFVWNTGNNVLIGQNAGAYNYTNGGGYSNVGVGDNALAANTTGTRNTVVGVYGGQLITTGSYNTGTGQRVLAALSTGSLNTADGYHGLFGLTTGSNNTGVGAGTGSTLTTESNNTLIGFQADITAGNNNSVAIGYNAKTTASNQIRLGTVAETVSIPGAASITGNTTVGGTIAVTGAATLSSTLAVTGNATVGGTLGVTGNTTLSGTVGVTGATTLSGAATVATADPATSPLTLKFAASQTNLTAIQLYDSANTPLLQIRGDGIRYGNGTYLMFATSGTSTFVGLTAGTNYANGTMTGGNNTAVGVGSSAALTSGSFNTAVGLYTLLAATTGTGNSAFGSRSLSVLTTGSSNCGYGRGSLQGITTGSNNVGVGISAGIAGTTESGNTCIGYASNITAGISNATAIGINAVATASNQIRLGTASETVSIPGALAVTGAVTLSAGLVLPTLADSAAANGTIYLSSTNTDGAGAPKLCRKSAAGTVTVIG